MRPADAAPSFATYYSIVDPSQLVAGDVYWDDPGTTPEVETKYQVMSDALQAAGAFLEGELGADETQWAWGRLHGLLLSADVSTFGILDYNNPPLNDPLFANDGGLFTVDVANPGISDFVQTAGASTRFVCEASADRAHLHHPAARWTIGRHRFAKLRRSSLPLLAKRTDAARLRHR